ncbi:Ribosomal protein L1 [Glarea lozoyensis ATCC 20868]|uniref:Ribosomal protein L1 n=1 Tax=Glarea lozoyensis (strain ATCC 20868 / MF5171) TaxID=1116229 RepID=S3CMI8_GLAL2|nr:Ribosomal protein L1 [Glarea lozoyensis ATCC 20868]EPE26424.1 Ribosomal protein L1 [Glarea lozoyensis ATCC 20868]
MAPASNALTLKAENGTPYQLSHDQVLRASKALLVHVKKSEKEEKTSDGKKSLLEDDEDDDIAAPIWLNLATKKHIVDKKRLKPSKIALPHSLNTSENTKICLIVADPQRKYKDIVADPAFPAEWASRISKVVGIKKIKKKHNTFEAQRKLKAEHDIFLADDRIIVALPKALGKTFYKGTKRPIPVSLTGSSPRTDAKLIAAAGAADTAGTAGTAGSKRPEGTPQEIAKQIKAALDGTSVYLSPSASTSVKVGYSNWDAKKLAENIEAAANGLIEKHVPQKWRGVKSLHVKGESTAALPIWLADELWVEEGDVVSEEKYTEVAKPNVGKKRKNIEAVSEEKVEKVKAPKKQKLIESNDDNLDKEIVARKEKLKKQKEEAAMDVVDEVPKASKTKKVKKAKVAAE